MEFLVSTDLDGTLLDHHTYSWHAAIPAIELCKEQKIPIIFNTSKTADEVRTLQKQIGISGSMIVENGSALTFSINSLKPVNMKNNDFFEKIQSLPDSPAIKIQNTQITSIFGALREDILGFIKDIRQETSWQFEGFSDWSLEQIIANTDLSHQAAKDASRKLFSEPFIWNDEQQYLDLFIQLAKQAGLQVLKGGRFFHLQGDTNKAKPLLWLKQLIGEFSRETELKLICLGDNHNDIDMLNIADYPVCVRSPVANFPKLKKNKTPLYTNLEGPHGWNQAILDILQR